MTATQNSFTIMPTGTKSTVWSFEKILKEYGNSLTDTPKYQRPDVFGFVRKGSGSDWQRNLIRSILMGDAIPELHFRFIKSDGLSWIIEIVDGGHRTRTVYHFLNDSIKTPKDCTLTDIEGNIYNIGDKHLSQIISSFPQLANYIYNLTFKVVEYHNLDDDAAEKLFLTLNDLNDMSPADKRNAINNIIADTNRKYGAVDSPDAFTMFTSRSPVKTGLKADYTDLDAVSRQSDEIVSWAMYYLYSGGIFSKDFKGMDNQSVLDNMYRDTNLIKILQNPDSKFDKNLYALLSLINKIVTNHSRLDVFKRGGKWYAGPLKKLIMLVAEMHRVNDVFNFSKIKINTNEFFNSFNKATLELKQQKVLEHRPYQLYEIVDNKLVVAKVQPMDKNGVSKVGEAIYPFYEVFKGGARKDDLLYIYQHYFTKEYLNFGKITMDNRREFNKKVVDKLLAEQKNCCRLCNKLLLDGDYAVDHIAPHSLGGPTIFENSQLLCTSCNGQKSNGMTFQDVVYLCERLEVAPQLKEVVTGLAREVTIMGVSDRLSENDIRTVIKLLFK
jgi:hypothetical protein